MHGQLGEPFACVGLICWAVLSLLSGRTHGDLKIPFFGQCSVEFERFALGCGVRLPFV